jgi:hypothetical protein
MCAGAPWGDASVMAGGVPSLLIARQVLDAGATELAATIGVGRATLYRHLDLCKGAG